MKIMRKIEDYYKLREVKISTGFMQNALASCLIEHGNTKVICCASLEQGTPRWLKGQGRGWITAEYSMLPTSTHQRTDREVNRGKLSGRTQEIQRLIGRSLRNICNLSAFGEKIIKIDCDVISADGGTRTASINGSWVALQIAINTLKKDKVISSDPIRSGLSAISCGVVNDKVILDLNYTEDSNADADANFVFNSAGNIVEIQCTGEKKAITEVQFKKMYSLSKSACAEIFLKQKNSLLLGDKH